MWYFAEGEQQQGPVSQQDLINLIHAGKLKPETLVWQEGMESWQPLQDVPQLQAELPTPLRDLPPPPDTFDSATPKPIYEDAVVAPQTTPWPAPAASASQTVYLPPGGFWRRALAYMLDGVISTVILIPFALILGVFLGILLTVFANHPLYPVFDLIFDVIVKIFSWFAMATYHGYFLSQFGATPGKMALGLQVMRQEGNRLTFMHGVGRYFAEYLSMLLCGIGYFMVLFNERKLALHDYICKTQVIET
jgi:uncharacterized RDD family membrane protein YckC